MSTTQSIPQTLTEPQSEPARRRDVWNFVANALASNSLPTPASVRLHLYPDQAPIAVLEFDTLGDADEWGGFLDAERTGPVEHDHHERQWTEVRWWDDRLGWKWQIVGRVDRCGGAA